jgi:hypothetical protein
VFAQPCRAAVDSVTTLCITDRSAVGGYTGPLTQSFILTKPLTFSGNVVILLDGGDGNIQLTPATAGCPETTTGSLDINSSNFLVRTRWLFASDGCVVITLDEASDFKATIGLVDHQSDPNHLTDILQVISWARANYSGSNVWVVGTSRATAGAFLAALNPAPAGPDGLVFTSPVNDAGDPDSLLRISGNPLPLIKVPTLVTSNPADACPASTPSRDTSVVGMLISAPVTGYLSFPGGNPPLTDPCDGLSAHGYFGIEPSTVNSIVQWIIVH